jgi:hypothetical protein
MQRLTRKICLAILILIGCSEGYAQVYKSKPKERKLIVYVCDEDGNTLTGIVLCSKGKGVPSEPTDITGRTEIILTDNAAPGEPIDLMLVKEVRANQGWEIIPAARLLIHAFDNKANTFTTVPLRKMAIRMELERLLSQSKGDGDSASDPPPPSRVNDISTLNSLLQRTQVELTSIYMQLGHSHYSQEKYPDALEAYKKALSGNPSNDVILYHIALTLSHLEKIEDAILTIEECLEIRETKPLSIDLASTYETYASLLIRVSRKDEAEEKLILARAIRARLSRRSRKQ